MSDEHAGYVKGDSPRDEGFDNSMTMLSTGMDLFRRGDDEPAQLMAECEAIQMPPGDQVEARLRIAFGRMHQDDYSEALRAFASKGTVATRSTADYRNRGPPTAGDKASVSNCIGGRHE